MKNFINVSNKKEASPKETVLKAVNHTHFWETVSSRYFFFLLWSISTRAEKKMCKFLGALKQYFWFGVLPSLLEKEKCFSDHFSRFFLCCWKSAVNQYRSKFDNTQTYMHAPQSNRMERWFPSSTNYEFDDAQFVLFTSEFMNNLKKKSSNKTTTKLLMTKFIAS